MAKWTWAVVVAVLFYVLGVYYPGPAKTLIGKVTGKA